MENSKGQSAWRKALTDTKTTDNRKSNKNPNIEIRNNIKIQITKILNYSIL